MVEIDPDIAAEEFPKVATLNFFDGINFASTAGYFDTFEIHS